MIERIKFLISHLGLSTRAFALSCGLRQNTLSNQLNGIRELSLSTIMAILDSYPDLSSEWLMLGSGNMFLSDNSVDDQDSKRRDKLIGVIETMQETIELKDSTIATLNERIKQLENQLKNK